MSGKSLTFISLFSMALLSQCSNPANSPSDSEQFKKIMERLPDSFISFYPLFDQSPEYNPVTHSYPNCVQDNCGKPITFITNNTETLTVNTVGTSYPSYHLSPNQYSLLIQDDFGTHVLSRDNYKFLKNDPDFYQDRGGAILDDGQAVTISHLGAIEINGKSGFGSSIDNFNQEKTSQRRQLIDGELIQCENSAFLISYGDEKSRNQSRLSYEYDWKSGIFVDLNLELTNNPVSMYFTSCIDSQSFQYIRTTDNSYMFGEWSKSNGFSDIAEVNMEDVRRPNGTSNFLFKEDGIYYLDDASNLYFCSFHTGDNELVLAIKDKADGIDFTETWAATVMPEGVLIVGKSAHNVERHAAVLIDIESQAILQDKIIPQLDQVYGVGGIGDVRVSKVDKALTWLASLPDNKP